MLDDLDLIPWSELEHAYGSAEDVPDVIRALLSSDIEEREAAQDMLYIGPLHQGTVTSCMPYVARFLIELLASEITPDRAWIVRYLTTAARVCYSCGEIDESAIPRSARKYIFREDAEQYQVERSLCQELNQHVDLFWNLLDSDMETIRASVPTLLVRLRCQDTDLRDKLNSRLRQETSVSVRVSLAFCLGILCIPDALAEKHLLESILGGVHEHPIVRLAAGFGLINGFRQDNSPDRLQQLAALIRNFPSEVSKLESQHGRELDSLARVWPNTRLLGALYMLTKEQQTWFIASIEDMCRYARENGGFGIGYYEGVLKQLKHSGA